ncbi:MAG TPA: DUF4435 domain-containing protein [Caulobacteraceae bacterium]|jgi:hypothetical protein
MKSIASQIDARAIAAEVRMERQSHRGAFLLLEGGTDIKRFERIIDEPRCSVVNCFGKVNVVEAIEILYDDGFVGALGLIDADFDRILGKLPDHEGLVASATHDFDLDVATTSALERYLTEVADQAKLRTLGGARPLLDGLLTALKPLTAMRFANQKHKLGYSFDSLDLEPFFDGESINVEKMVEEVSWGKHAADANKAALVEHIGRYAGSNIDLFQATCGHDLCAALGIALRGLAGDRKRPQTWRSEIEMHLRLAFDLDHFREMPACRQIAEWEFDNPPHSVVRT